MISIQLRVIWFDVDIGEHLFDRVPSDVFPEGQPPAVPYHLRRHDARFEGCGISYDPVRMDPALVREDIFTNNRLGWE